MIRSFYLFVIYFIFCAVSDGEDSSYKWDNVAIGGGGYVTGISLHPKAPGNIYIRTDIGGFYRFNTKSKHWMPLTDAFGIDKEQYYGGEGLALDPNNPEILYIAAGKYLWGPYGSIFKSTDSGATWQKLPIDILMGGNDDLRWAGERLAVDPFDSVIVLFGSRKDGLYRTVDGGQTWNLTGKIGNPSDVTGISGILFDPLNKGRVLATVYGDGIYESNDHGITWKRLDDSPTKTMRMCFSSDGSLYTAGRASPKIAKMNRYGEWSDISPETAISNDFCAIDCDPFDPAHVIIGVDQQMPGRIFQTFNSGVTWSEMTRNIGLKVPWFTEDGWGAAMAQLAFDPHLKGHLLFTDWFGVWETFNAEKESPVWNITVNGIEEIVSFCMVAPPEGFYLVSGIADCTGMIHKSLDSYPESRLGTKIYQDTYSIDYCSKKPLNLVRVSGNRYNDEYGGAYSEDGGLTWKTFGIPIKKNCPTRIAVSADDPNTFIVMLDGNNAFVTTTNGVLWEKIDTLPTGFSGPWDWRQPLAADRVNGKKFYYYDSGKFYRSEDGGRTFSPVNSSLPNGALKIGGNLSVKAAPSIEGEVWASFDIYGLYRSSDSGSTFSKIENIDRAILFAFGKTINGINPEVYLYGVISGKEGVFRSSDLGTTWDDISPVQSVGIGDSPNFMEASKQHAGLVFIGTNGRGIFYGRPSEDTEVRIDNREQFEGNKIKIFPNPFNETSEIEVSLSAKKYVELDIYNISGQKICRLVSDILYPGTHRFRWDGKDTVGNRAATGLYLVRLSDGIKAGYARMSLIK